MKFKSSKKIFAHIDCDSFFAECEILKNPHLKNKYVLVWNEIVLACNYKTKYLWIKTWTPVWQAENILNWKWFFLSPDHDFYSLVSSKLMTFLQENTLSLEPFSIDEAFCEITGLPELEQISLLEYTKNLQIQIQKNIWIPVSIWISNTRIKAKIFSKLNKPLGVFIDLSTSYEIYKNLHLSIVPFIWKASQNNLKYKCENVYDFLSLWFWYLKNNYGKSMTDLRLELSWVNAFVVKKTPFSKSISRGRSFNKNITNDFDFLFSQLLLNFNYLFEEFSIKNYETKKVLIFFRYFDKKTYFFEQKLAFYTNDRKILLEIVKKIFILSYNKSNLYRSTGIVFSSLKDASFHQTHIFENNVFTKNYNTDIYKLINNINKKYNSHKISFWSDLLGKSFSSKLWIRK